MKVGDKLKDNDPRMSWRQPLVIVSFGITTAAGAEHDQFYAYATDKSMTPEDVQKMRDLDWFQPDQEEEAPYSPEDGWSAFT